MKVKKAKLCFCFAIIWGLFGCGFPDDIPHKSDAEMIENFKKNKPDFENLVEMIRQDETKIGKRLFRIDKDWTEPKKLDEFGINEERVKAYREILRKLNIKRGFYAYGDGTTYLFISSAQGLGVSGSSKGYMWTAEPPKSLIDTDLDEYHQKQKNPNDFIFRQIEGNWYLERESS